MVRHLCALGIGIAVVAGPAKLQPAVTAQQPACLHGPNETEDQAARRRSALGFVRRINSLQIQHHANGKMYQPLSSMPDVEAPAGFSIRQIVDATGYTISVKDTVDPCHFAYFSDHEQVIYTAQPIR